MKEVKQSVNKPGMIIKVRDDLIDVIDRLIEILQSEHPDYLEINSISNRTIHDASIYQDDDSVSMAVLVYSLGKLIQRCVEENHKLPMFSPLLVDAKSHLVDMDLDEYRSAIKKIFNIITDHDKQLKLYIEEVLHQARIRKASRIHGHGISIAKTAEILGISQWELMNYVGGEHQEDFPEITTVKERYEFARSLFE